jgi:TRAP-type uncharacterized transport system substrate-binding protein
MNANTVAVISGTPGGTYFRMASDLAFALDDGDNLRILPVLGKGAGQNAYDVRFLRGIDIGFVRTDTLEQLRQDNRLKEVDRRIAYIARLFNDELHVIVPNETKSIEQLVGKKVSFDVAGSGTDYTGRSMFAGLGINVDAVNVDQPTAFSMLKKGELAAVVSVAAKPVAVVASFREDGFHLLPVPNLDNLADRYMPATLSHADYPPLVKQGETINTLSVGTILGVYNWPTNTERYTRVSRFVEAFYTHFDRLLEPQRHPKWKEVDLYADVPGWHRFPAAEAWVAKHRAEVAAAARRGQQQAQTAAPTVPDSLSPPPAGAIPTRTAVTADSEISALVEEFLRWRQRYRRR